MSKNFAQNIGTTSPLQPVSSVRYIQDWESAIDNYKQSVGIQPSYARPYISMGKAYEHLEMTDAAVDAYIHAMRLFANNGFGDETIDMMQRIQYLDPDNEEVQWLINECMKE